MCMMMLCDAVCHVLCVVLCYVVCDAVYVDSDGVSCGMIDLRLF